MFVLSSKKMKKKKLTTTKQKSKVFILHFFHKKNKFIYLYMYTHSYKVRNYAHICSLHIFFILSLMPLVSQSAYLHMQNFKKCYRIQLKNQTTTITAAATKVHSEACRESHYKNTRAVIRDDSLIISPAIATACYCIVL